MLFRTRWAASRAMRMRSAKCFTARPAESHLACGGSPWSRPVISQQPLRVTAARVINQSFEFGSHDAAEDERYDDYIALHHPVVVSGIGNGGAILTPSDCYNGIGVGAYGGSSSNGPTNDGRCKPDLVAPRRRDQLLDSPGVRCSRRPDSGRPPSRPPCRRRHGLPHRESASSEWRGQAPGLEPFLHRSPRFQLRRGRAEPLHLLQRVARGKHPPSHKTAPELAQGHPAAAAGSVIGTGRGWDLRRIGSSAGRNGVNHYRMQGSGNFAATLVWNRDLRPLPHQSPGALPLQFLRQPRLLQRKHRR